MSWRMIGLILAILFGVVAFSALYGGLESGAVQQTEQNINTVEKNNQVSEDPKDYKDYTITCSLIDIGGQGLNMSVSYGYEAVTYRIIVQNTGNKSLTGVKIYDGWNSVTGPKESLKSDGILQVNESWVYKGRYVIPREELISYEDQSGGLLINPVRVIADNSESQRVEFKVPVLYDQYEFAFAEDDCINIGADGHTITLKNNLSAKDPTYAQVVSFIYMDTTDQKVYDEATWVCADYAETVHNDAESMGIKCAWVEVNFVDGSADHACNAFQTVDRGMIYIDCTEDDKVVELVQGANYTLKSLYSTTEYYEMPVVSQFKVFW